MLLENISENPILWVLKADLCTFLDILVESGLEVENTYYLLPFWCHSDSFLTTTIQAFHLLMEVFFHTLFFKIMKFFQILVTQVEFYRNKYGTKKIIIQL